MSTQAIARATIEDRDRSGGRRGTRRILASAWVWLPLICLLQVALAVRPGPNVTAFEDEGLYVYMGHRMLDHFLHGAFLQEYPGAYFSGAPGLYPPLAALADSAGGLQGARLLSTVFACVATVAVYGLGRRLFGRRPGLLGALVFVLTPGVIFQSHLATYDAMMMALVAVAAWLAVRSAQTDALLFAPVVGVLLALAALTKYAGLVYLPVVAALAVVVAWPWLRWIAVKRALFMVVAALVVFFFVIQVWGRDLVGGLKQTTLERSPLNPTSKEELLTRLALWVGPVVVLATVAALTRARRRPALMAVLLGGALVAMAQQVHLGESTSLAKHTAFGMIFAAPLVGDLLSRALRRAPYLTWVPVTAIVVGLGLTGLQHADEFSTGWIQDDQLVPVVGQVARLQPGKPVLGEQPSPVRYALRDQVAPKQWVDTYAFSFNGKSGEAAYADAVRLHYFGTIYLSSTTDNGAFLMNLLTSPDRDRYYNIKAKIPRYLRGQRVGEWLVFAPRSLELPAATA